ncbi:MAG: glycosyltransferase family 9 protein [Actinomycetota bacterium]|nr:glycosyltransferase family 9 protein [Actinomycetota bacterium]
MSHVLLVRLDSAGDVLLMGPAVRAVAPRNRVTFLCGRRGRAAAELLPGIDAIVEHTAPWIDPEPDALDPESTLALVAELAALALDQAIVFTSFHQSALPTALLLRLAGVPTVAAYSEEYPGSLLDLRLRDSGDIHEVERALSLAEALGHRPPPRDDLRLRVERPGGAPPAEPPYVVVHPGTSVPARAWPHARHAELVEVLAIAGRRVVVTGAPHERELTRFVAGERRPGVVDLGGRTSFAELADVLAGADAVVVGNTGPAHLAAAVGTPVVSLFAPTVPAARWAPWGVPAVLLGDQEAPCAGSRALVCPVEGHPCLASVQVSDVVSALAAVSRGVAAGREAETWDDPAVGAPR